MWWLTERFCLCAPQAHPKSVHITCAVVRDTMPTGRIHEGVASTWLHRQLAAGPGTQGKARV